jgi:hypothetical protein
VAEKESCCVASGGGKEAVAPGLEDGDDRTVGEAGAQHDRGLGWAVRTVVQAENARRAGWMGRVHGPKWCPSVRWFLLDARAGMPGSRLRRTGSGEQQLSRESSVFLRWWVLPALRRPASGSCWYSHRLWEQAVCSALDRVSLNLGSKILMKSKRVRICVYVYAKPFAGVLQQRKSRDTLNLALLIRCICTGKESGERLGGDQVVAHTVFKNSCGIKNSEVTDYLDYIDFQKIQKNLVNFG